MDVKVGLWRKLSTEEWMLLNCGVGEDSWESLGLQADQLWVFFGRIDANAETPILWPPRAKSWLIGKDSDAGRDWGQEEKGTTEDEMAGWHHRLYGCEFQWTPEVGDGQGGLACCNSWGCRVGRLSNWTEHLLQTLEMLFCNRFWCFKSECIHNKQNKYMVVAFKPGSRQSLQGFWGVY